MTTNETPDTGTLPADVAALIRLMKSIDGDLRDPEGTPLTVRRMHDLLQTSADTLRTLASDNERLSQIVTDACNERDEYHDDLVAARARIAELESPCPTPDVEALIAELEGYTLVDYKHGAEHMRLLTKLLPSSVSTLRTLASDNERLTARIAELEGQVAPRLARNQPCGCVVCTCEDEIQCHGCGANHCGTHPIGEIPNPVYEQTWQDQLAQAAKAERAKIVGELNDASEMIRYDDEAPNKIALTDTCRPVWEVVSESADHIEANGREQG